MKINLLLWMREKIFENKMVKMLIKTPGIYKLAVLIRSIYGKLWTFTHRSYTVNIAGITAEFRVDYPEEALGLLDFAGEKSVIEFFLGQIKEGDIVYDIGANVGLYTILCAKKTGDEGLVVSFEPEPLSYKKLNENIKLNELKNVRTYSIALSDFNGKTKLNITGEGKANHNIRPLKRNISNKQQIEVDTRRLDDLIVEDNLPKPDLIKIDIEGAELNALRGMESLLKEQDDLLIVCEVHTEFLKDFGHSNEDLENFLRECGFIIEPIQGGRYETYFIKAIKSSNRK